MAKKTPISAELQDAVGRIVEEKLAAYGPEIDRKIASAFARAARLEERHPYVKKAVTDAIFGIEEVISAAYVPLEDDCWKLYVVCDGDCLADLVKRLISGIRKAEKLPSVPLLDLQLVHASESAGMPGNSRTIFAKT